MRILALVTEAFGGHRGISRFNRIFLSSLNSAASDIQIVVLPRLTRETIEPLPQGVTQLPAPTNKLTYVLSAVKVFLKEGPFDLIFCGHLHLAFLAAGLAALGKIPFWLQIYGIEAWSKPSSFYRWAVARASLVTALSRYTRRRFLRWSVIAPDRVRILPATVDSKFQPGPKPDYLMERYRLVDKKILLTLTYLSSKERYKGIDRIIRLMSNLLKEHPDLVYVVAGNGDDHNHYEAIAREENLSGIVRFIGEVKESELVDHYRMADLFVMPSTGEGFGIVFLEAASCGIPVVGGNEDGSFDALLEGRLGYTVELDGSRELRRAILDDLNSKAIYPEAEQVEKFSNENFSRLIKTLLKQGINSEKRVG